MQIKQHLLDKRVVKRALQEGLLDKAQYQKTLDELPDLSHRVQQASAEDDEDDDDTPVAHEPPPSSSANSF